MIPVLSCSTTSHGFTTGTALLSGITDATGVQFRMEPGPATIDRHRILVQGDTPFAWLPAGDVYYGLNGILDFKEVGKQSLRIFWMAGPSPGGYFTRGDSGIKEVTDVAGRKVAWYSTYPLVNAYMESFLAFGYLTYDDVVPIAIAGYAQGQKAPAEGVCDVAFSSTTTPPQYELEKSIHGIHWIPLPAADTEGWARLQAVAPYWYPRTIITGAGISAASPLQSQAYSYQIACYDWADEDLIYWMTKQLHTRYDAYKDKHAILHFYTLENALDISKIFAPFHPGAIRYFKEIGAWTPANEALQQNLLAQYPFTTPKGGW